MSLHDEELIPLSAAAKYAPGGAHRGAPYRWIKTGLTGPKGVVHLEYTRVGAQLMTSGPAVRRFFAAFERQEAERAKRLGANFVSLNRVRLDPEELSDG